MVYEVNKILRWFKTKYLSLRVVLFNLSLVPCSPGTFRTYDPDQIDYECEPCPKNSYQDEESAELCKDCPFGLKTLGTGATSLNDCLGKIAQVFGQSSRHFLIKTGLFAEIPFFLATSPCPYPHCSCNCTLSQSLMRMTFANYLLKVVSA